MQLSATTVPIGPNRTLEMSLGCYLIQTSDAKNILIDTGIAPDAPLPPGAPKRRHETNVIDQLAALNLRPADIHTLICTHFDVDHAGYNDAFPQAEHIVQREHYELARSGYERLRAARSHWDHPAIRYRQVDGDTELFPGLTSAQDQRPRSRPPIRPRAPPEDRPNPLGHRRRDDAAHLHARPQSLAQRRP